MRTTIVWFIAANAASAICVVRTPGLPVIPRGSSRTLAPMRATASTTGTGVCGIQMPAPCMWGFVLVRRVRVVGNGFKSTQEGVSGKQVRLCRRTSAGDLLPSKTRLETRGPAECQKWMFPKWERLRAP